jgi:hypothetical protein
VTLPSTGAAEGLDLPELDSTTYTGAMAEHVARVPFGFDPLIAEAKHRMRRRRGGLAAILLAAACLALSLSLALRPDGPVLPNGASPTFTRVGWSGPINVNGRAAIRATVYWIRVSPSHWAVRASVVNLTRHTLRPARAPFDTGWGMEAVTAGLLAHPVQCSGSSCFDSRAASFRPALPRTLPPGARWTGVFSGTAGPWGKVPRNRWASFSLGYYYGSKGGFGIGTPIGRPIHIR